MGHTGLEHYLWYHTIDLGNGLITPGNYDYRSSLPSFGFPTDMTGMSVLDVGSATGFFSFEFEKRGASVTSVELPSIADWDMPPGDRTQTLDELMSFHRVSTIEEVQHLHLDGPFDFCHKALKSNVRRCHSTLYDLSPHKLGTPVFDLVFVGDVLLHTFSPLKALACLSQFCGKKLIISQALADIDDGRPVMQYLGGERRGGDNRSWWFPNKLCFEQMLKRLGFTSVEVVGYHAGVIRPDGHVYRRAVIHAAK